MNTPAHLIVGATAFTRKDARSVNLAVIAGSLAPDLSLYILAAYALFVLDIPDFIVFGELYYSEQWQGIFAIDNSFLLWAALLAFASAFRLRVLLFFALAGLLHLATDFPLHHDDGRMHFWPLSDWIFRSPVSYWDPAHHGNIVGFLEIGICAALCIVLFRRYSGWPARIGIVSLGILEIAPAVLYRMI